jgi:hypothetical protein
MSQKGFINGEGIANEKTTDTYLDQTLLTRHSLSVKSSERHTGLNSGLHTRVPLIKPGFQAKKTKNPGSGLNSHVITRVPAV